MQTTYQRNSIDQFITKFLRLAEKVLPYLTATMVGLTIVAYALSWFNASGILAIMVYCAGNTAGFAIMRYLSDIDNSHIIRAKLHWTFYYGISLVIVGVILSFIL